VASIIITIPDIPDAYLIYNEEETRRILKHFWPDAAAAIDGLKISNNTRRFAQTMLIAAIDGSYAMGYMAITFDAVRNGITGTNRDIVVLGRRLARNFVQHWWRHTRRQDLENVRIYESVRADIAWRQKESFGEYISGIALRRGATTLVLMKLSSSAA
jgi:hypothetical protein